MKNFNKIFFCLVLILASLSSKAQDILYGPTVSYQFQKGSAIKTGGYFAISFDGDHIFKTDVTANFTWAQNKFAVIPEAAFTYYPAVFIITPLVRAEITPYTITPKLGFSVATLFEFDLGYGMSINEKKDYRPIKGFAGSIRFNIPLNFRLNM